MKKPLTVFALLLGLALPFPSLAGVTAPVVQQQVPAKLFAVRVNGLEGRMDTKGHVVIPAKFVQIRTFVGGLASFEIVTAQGPRDGVINEAGDIVIPAQYDYIGDFSQGFAPVEWTDPKTGNKRADFINTSGQLLFNNPKITRTNGFSEGLAPVELVTAQGPRWGYWDKTGKTVIPLQYGYAFPFQGSVGYVIHYNDLGPFASTSLGAILTRDGKVLIDALPGSGNYEFHDGLVGVKVKDQWGYMDKTGHLVIPPQYESLEFFSQGLAGVQQQGKWGFIDKTGKWVAPPQYMGVLPFSEGLAPVNTSAYVEGYRAQYGYLDKTGKMAIPPQFEDAQKFSEGLAPVEKDHKWGYIDTTGKFIIKPKFQAAEPFQNGLARVGIRRGFLSLKEYGYIDKTGKYIWKPTR